MDFYFEFDFAIHITWTTYGTWLPGDERGYVANTLQRDGRYARRQNQPGRAFTKDSAITRQRAAALQKHPTTFLTPPLALAVAEELVAAAAQREWYIARAAVMAGHVHAVVMKCPADGPAVRRILKGTAQARLSKLWGSPKKWWTQSGSDRYKKSRWSIENAIWYVARQENMLAGVCAMQPYLVGVDRRFD
jgi:REP element-mobilizing transposase RayT